MLQNHTRREQKKTVSDRSLRILHLLLCISILSFSSMAVFAGEPPDINRIVTPAAVDDVVYISPFTLKEGYQYDWRQERPFINSGTLAVFKVNPDLVYPRNAAEPVLYAGNQTAQRLNYGHESGYVIAIIPGEVDLAREPVWFGRPELPERVNAKTIDMERERAERAGIRPFEAKKIQSITHKRFEASNLAMLLRDYIAELVVNYSPQEKNLAETWRLPIAQR